MDSGPAFRKAAPAQWVDVDGYERVDLMSAEVRQEQHVR